MSSQREFEPTRQAFEGSPLPRTTVAPIATYRLQLLPDLDRQRLTSALDYLAALGVSHVYFSPYFAAAPDSTHGYDVADFSAVHPILGPDGHAFLCAALRARGLGQIVDMIPNHMGIRGASNPWWWDVLQRGATSVHFQTFDIDLSLDPSGKIALPILHESLRELISTAAVTVRTDKSSGRFVVQVGSDVLPLREESVLDFSERTLEALNSDPDRLWRLLDQQHYRLVRHAEGRDEINYRRYLNIDGLAALNSDSVEVFERVHAQVIGWVKSGQVDGIRIDHPDGLADPASYFQRLRAAVPAGWLLAEKPLPPDKGIPEGWPIDGTTGYDFLSLCNGLFVDPVGLAGLQEIWTDVALPGEESFEPLVASCKRRVLTDDLQPEVRRTARFAAAACKGSDTNAAAETEWRQAVVELCVALPVGRTYRRPGGKRSGADDEAILVACRRAAATCPEVTERLLAIQQLLLGPLDDPAAWRFGCQFQQLTIAATAKGVEDQAFYRYGPLLSLCELGCDPRLPAFGLADFHAHCARVSTESPLTLNATSTHDSKRGEDARLRLTVLSEMPITWKDALGRWRALLGGLPPLDGPMVYDLFQTLVGVWPISESRLIRYAIKAARESRRMTSWTRPDETYEKALISYVHALLSVPAFISDLKLFLAPLVQQARFYSLGQTLLKLTAPGVPDIYQGSELWEEHLVDPDNRRPVDFKARHEMLLRCRQGSFEAALSDGAGMAKLWLLNRVLNLRRTLPEALGPNSHYQPLPTSGRFAEQIVGFQRGNALVTLVPRWLRRLTDGWQDTTCELPEGRWVDLLTEERWSGGRVACDSLFARFPGVLLRRC